MGTIPSFLLRDNEELNRFNQSEADVEKSDEGLTLETSAL